MQPTPSDSLAVDTTTAKEGGHTDRETLEDQSQLPKKANKCSSYEWQHRHVLNCHRESTDSLIL